MKTPILLIDGVRYRQWTPKDEEKEFFPIIQKNHKEIFGPDSIFFDLKPRLASKSGIAAIPDAYVITLSKPSYWYVVEIELASHPIYDHIVKQLSKFINGIENLISRNEIRETLYNEIRDDRVLKAQVEEKIGPQEIHHFLTDLIQRDPKIVVIIDQATDEVKEACKVLKYDTEVLEFKIYRRENAESVHIYSFEPIATIHPPPPPPPPPRRTWENKLGWTEPSNKDLALKVINEVRGRFKDVVESPSGKNYCFYKSRKATRFCFAALLLTKRSLKIRVRVDPVKFSDPQKWLTSTIYKGWFFEGPGQERGFSIQSIDQVDYAMKLISQSYTILT